MSLVKEQKDQMFITRFYSIDAANDRIEAVKWLSNARNVSGLIVEEIAFRDSLNRFSEGNEGSQLKATASVEEMISRVDGRAVDTILIKALYDDAVAAKDKEKYIAGLLTKKGGFKEYQNKMVIIGIELDTCRAYITVRTNASMILETLEETLELV